LYFGRGGLPVQANPDASHGLAGDLIRRLPRKRHTNLLPWAFAWHKESGGCFASLWTQLLSFGGSPGWQDSGLESELYQAIHKGDQHATAKRNSVALNLKQTGLTTTRTKAIGELNAD
jgi:hypothetical protein